MSRNQNRCCSNAESPAIIGTAIKETPVAIMPANAITSLGLSDGSTVRVVDQREPRQTYGRVFMTIFSEEMAHIALNLRHGSTLRVLLTLPMHLSWTDFRRLNQIALAKELSMAQATISGALKQLLDVGAIERRGKGPVTEWKLSPDWGWNGRAGAWRGTQRLRGRNTAPGAPQMPGRHPPTRVAAEGIAGKPAATARPKAEQRDLRLLSVVTPPQQQ